MDTTTTKDTTTTTADITTMVTTTMAMATEDMDTTTDIAMVIVATTAMVMVVTTVDMEIITTPGMFGSTTISSICFASSLSNDYKIIISNIKLETVVLYALELQLWLQQLRTQR